MVNELRRWIRLVEGEADMSPHIQWARRCRYSGDTVVWIDVAKLDASWSHDSGFYITPGGGGASIRGRYERFGKWLEQGHAIEMPEVGINTHYDRLVFVNGRHRFAWLRDHGVTTLPVCAAKEQAKLIKQRFGSALSSDRVDDGQLSLS